MSDTKEVKSSTASSASNDKVLAAVATMPVVGLIIFYVMKDASPLVKNYAKQSNAVLAMEVVSMVVAIVPILGWIASFFLGIAALVAWVVLLIKAFNGEMYKLPYVGDYFDQLLK